MSLSRRIFLKAGVVTAGIAGIESFSGLSVVGSMPHALAAEPLTASTTLARTAAPGNVIGNAYHKLCAGSGWPLYIREELTQAAARRGSHTKALASFVQFTDMHIVDVQSPARLEFLSARIPSAFRPQEALTTQGLVSMVQHVNSIGKGPFTQRPFDCVVTTGDNTDNCESIELEWYQTILSGGEVTPNTGSETEFEGVQNMGNPQYWQPESDIQDLYKKKGFPEIPGFLDAAIKTHSSPGLNFPWYAIHGNHDDQLQGTVPLYLLDSLYLSNQKFDIKSGDQIVSAIADSLRAGIPNPKAMELLLATAPVTAVTPDRRRARFTPREFVSSHFKPELEGAGPIGHGFSSPESETWYSFSIAPGVRGIAMDTTNSNGLANGSLNQRQLDWMMAEIEHHQDELFLLFSHHTSRTMDVTVPNPRFPQENTYTGPELIEKFKTQKNIVAWINGHTHANEMIPHRASDPLYSFWEINTASHVDYPQLARIIELVDNRDGTLSIFTPLIESDAAYSADFNDLTPQGLASLYREFSYNDVHRDSALMGKVEDRNCELLLSHPLY